MLINQLSFFDSSFPVSVGDIMYVYARKNGYENIGKFQIFSVFVTSIDFTKNNYRHEVCFYVQSNEDVFLNENYYFEDINSCIFYDIDSLKKHYHIK